MVCRLGPSWCWVPTAVSSLLFPVPGRGLCQETLLGQSHLGTSKGLTQKVGRNARGGARHRPGQKRVRLSVYNSEKLAMTQMLNGQRGEGG